MPLLPLLIVIFIQSASTALLEHAIFFYTRETMGFSVMQNLLLALLFGVAYVPGAIKSHTLTDRLGKRFSGQQAGGGERLMLVLLIVGLMLVGITMALFPAQPWAFWIGLPVIGFLSGVHWPIMESYVVAGRTRKGPRSTSKAIGKFNIAWSSAVVLGVAVAGPLIHTQPTLMLALCPALNLIAIVLILRTFPAQAAHLDDDHADQPSPEIQAAYAPLSRSAKWSMLSSYTLMFVLGPYLPDVFETLGYSVAIATLLAAVLHLGRMLSFIVFERWHGWHGLRWPLALGAVAMPAGALMVLLGVDVTTVIAGELLFSFFAGIVYTASLYYGMVMKNASIEGGGNHEAVIGAGFTAGPVLGMGGEALAVPLGKTAGITVGLAPIIVVGIVGGLWPLRRAISEGVPKDASLHHGDVEDAE